MAKDSISIIERSSIVSRKLIWFVGAFLLIAIVAVAIAVPLALQDDTEKSDAEFLEKANKLLEEAPIFDGHNDYPWRIRSNTGPQYNISEVDMSSDLSTSYNTDISRLKAGHVGAQFWSGYVPCSSQNKDAVRLALEQIDIIQRLAQQYSDDLVFVTSVAELDKAFEDKKIAGLVGMEGGHMLDSSLGALRMYYQLGTRYITLTHSCNTPWAENWSNENTSVKGLTEFGKHVVMEMNRLGMLIDLAHVSDNVMNDVFDITKSPIIFSHSSVREICDTDRNVPDDLLKRLADNQGVVMINFYNGYITCGLTANVSDVADHFDYVKNLIGAQYVGMGSDFDGVPRLPDGLNDVSMYPNLVAELLKRGWTDNEIKGASSGNIRRVFAAAEKASKELKNSGMKPLEYVIPPGDVAGNMCRSDY